MYILNKMEKFSIISQHLKPSHLDIRQVAKKKIFMILLDHISKCLK